MPMGAVMSMPLWLLEGRNPRDIFPLAGQANPFVLMRVGGSFTMRPAAMSMTFPPVPAQTAFPYPPAVVASWPVRLVVAPRAALTAFQSVVPWGTSEWGRWRIGSARRVRLWLCWGGWVFWAHPVMRRAQSMRVASCHGWWAGVCNIVW